MTKRKVTVVLLPSSDGGYGVYLPLFPNCTTQGETVEEALNNAREALELVLEDPSDVDLESLDYAYSPVVTIGEIEVEVPEQAISKATAVR